MKFGMMTGTDAWQVLNDFGELGLLLLQAEKCLTADISHTK